MRNPGCVVGVFGGCLRLWRGKAQKKSGLGCEKLRVIFGKLISTNNGVESVGCCNQERKRWVYSIVSFHECFCGLTGWLSVFMMEYFIPILRGCKVNFFLFWYCPYFLNKFCIYLLIF